MIRHAAWLYGKYAEVPVRRTDVAKGEDHQVKPGQLHIGLVCKFLNVMVFAHGCQLNHVISIRQGRRENLCTLMSHYAWRLSFLLVPRRNDMTLNIKSNFSYYSPQIPLTLHTAGSVLYTTQHFACLADIQYQSRRPSLPLPPPHVNKCRLPWPQTWPHPARRYAQTGVCG